MTVFLKNITLEDLSEKYGAGSKGLVVHENVAKGEALWPRLMTDKTVFTREQLVQLKSERPDLAEALRSYSCQSGDDLFTVPTSCLDGTTIDARQFINHSCDPVCGYATGDDGKTYIVALRDLAAGEELVYHYGMLETEMSLTYGLECKCGSAKCTGKWAFDLYRRDDELARDLMQYAKPELKLKAEALRSELWHSAACFLKRAADDAESLSLSARCDIGQGELVARLLDADQKYLSNVDDVARVNCSIRDNEVFALRPIREGETIFVPSKVNVYCDGVFDLFHLGHQNHLRNCSRVGNQLFVGVVSDKTAASYKRQPEMSEEQRMAVVANFDGVSKVIPDAPMIVDETFLKEHDIDLVCISPEYDKPDDVYYAVPRKMGMLRVMTRTEGISTTELLERRAE